MRESCQAVPASEYAPRRPETTILYGVVQRHLETWLAQARSRERIVPGFVERELRAFLDCGILANGFLTRACRFRVASPAKPSEATRNRIRPLWCGDLCPEIRWALNLNVHFHTLVLDGAYRPSGDGGTLRFHTAPPPTAEELERVLSRVVHGIARVIERRGLGDEPDALSEEDPLLAQLLAAAVQGRVATGACAGQRVLRFGDRVQIAAETADPAGETPGLARASGFSLHAAVAVPANDRKRLERLCRYVGRPPVATERLRELEDGRLLYELRHRWRDGTSHVAFEPLELIDRLAALVPPPRFHTVRYHGVLASRSKHRAAAVPNQAKAVSLHSPTAIASTPDDSSPVDRAPVAPRTSHPSRYYSWSELMSRVFEIDVLQCPRCKATPMRILAAIHPPMTTQAILNSLGLPTRAPPIAPARPVSPDWTLAEPSPPFRHLHNDASPAA